MTQAELVRTLNARGLTACLFDGDQEVVVPGYKPVTIRNWTITDTPSLAFVVQFGPYYVPIEYDRYAILDGETPKASGTLKTARARSPDGSLGPGTSS